MSSFDVLIDSDAFVGRFYPEDAHYTRASALFAQLEQQHSYTVTTSMVVDEVATVLSHRSGQKLARQFIRTLQEARFPLIHIDERLRAVALKLFVAQEQRGTSVTDCANVVVMQHFSIPRIFAFDDAYRRRYRVAVLR